MSAQVSPVEITTGNGTGTFSDSPKNDLLSSIAVFTIPRKFRRCRCRRKQLRLNTRYYPNICPDRLMRTSVRTASL
jgi:hypothetical protein